MCCTLGAEPRNNSTQDRPVKKEGGAENETCKQRLKGALYIKAEVLAEDAL